jgi:hypothetical protein
MVDSVDTSETPANFDETSPNKEKRNPAHSATGYNLLWTHVAQKEQNSN